MNILEILGGRRFLLALAGAIYFGLSGDINQAVGLIVAYITADTAEKVLSGKKVK